MSKKFCLESDFLSYMIRAIIAFGDLLQRKTNIKVETKGLKMEVKMHKFYSILEAIWLQI